MKKYNLYKDSGIEWMGDIPQSWFLTKNRYGFVKHKNGKNESNESYIGHQLVEKGDIVFTPRDFDQTPILSDVSKFYGCISNLYIVDKTNERILNHFVNYYWYGLKYSVDYFKNFSHGMRFSFNRFQFDEIPLLVPPISEQQQIVSFLDAKTSLIDSLIEKTQQKIELLKEKRTSLINEVVTKGLNPNVEMKDSGVEWIGKIPSHWGIKKVKHLIEDYGGIKIGPFGSSLKLDTLTEDGIKVYGQGNVIKDDFTLGHRHIPIERFESDFTQYEIYEGDVLITMMGTTGKSKVFKQSYKRGILDSHLLRLRFKKTSFISHLFVTILQESDYVFTQLKLTSKGSIMEGLNSSIVKQLTLMTPPISEQQQIVEYLDKQNKLIDKTISIEEKRIELLKEYRQSLISEVVTGKRKVV